MTTTVIKGNLIMEKDMEYDGDLIVEGDIFGKNGKKHNLKVNGNITAGDITAGDIIANDITADDIKAINIHAGNISYYAICFAYRSIKCKSIKGKRANSKHVVLDSKIEITK